MLVVCALTFFLVGKRRELSPFKKRKQKKRKQKIGFALSKRGQSGGLFAAESKKRRKPRVKSVTLKLFGVSKSRSSLFQKLPTCAA
jgi:hypothetical protein